SNADYIYKGRIGEKFIEVLENFGVRLIREKKPLNYYNLNLYEHYPFAPLLTTEGCPFRCTYCASTILSNGHYKIPIEDILIEIIEFYKRGVRDFVFYDDALLIDSSKHIKPILKKIIDLELDIRLHTPNGLHARFIDDELAFLMKRAGFKTIRLSLETVNSDRQIKTGAKVNNEDLINAVNCLKKEGYTKKEIGVYLMYGIPDQNLEEIKEGVEFLKTLGVRINLTEFSPIKGTLEWFNLINKKIIDNDLDPLLTNNSVFYYLYSTFDLKELEALKQDVKNYNNKQ
ncbi:MAG: radical SAM protein, partial [Thermodesulfovibrionales bacterium]|nr:radical SAM protein [Thermodesulfovibrionales bacterium]